MITFDETLAAAANLVNDPFTVKVGGSAVTLTGTPTISGATVALTLANAVAHSDTVTVSYTKPTTDNSNRLEDADGNETADFTDRAVDNITNAPATGKPAITGTAEVGQTLTAGTGTIADDNGLPATFPDDYSFQWYRVDADGTSNRTAITGATSATYTLAAAEQGNKVIVAVSFTDEDGHAETLESDAYPSTGTVADDGRGIILTPRLLPMAEGSSDTYTVKLSKQPTGTVTVTISGMAGTDVTVGDTTLEFTTTNWATAQTVTVTAAHDADGLNDLVPLTHTASGGGYDDVATESVVVTVLDDDRRVAASTKSLQVDEGGSETYTVTLATQPTGPVEVTISGMAGTDVTVDDATRQFTTANWNTAQTVTVMAAQDADAVNDEVTLTHTATGGGYGAGTATTVAVTVRDDERGVTVTPTTLPVAEGGSETYTVKLESQPTGTVTVTIGGLTGTDVTVGDTTLDFTTTDWNTAQTVTVTAAQDADAVNDEVTLTHTASGGGYDGVSIDSVAVTVRDDERGVTVTPTTLPVAEGGSDTYTVKLESQPAGTVTVTIGGMAGTDVTVGDTTLEFTTTNWNTAQTVTVSAAQDTDNVDDEVTLTHTPSGGDYGDVSIDSVVVTVLDDEATGAPAITGTAEVGQTLTAGQGDLADRDGLPAAFPGDYTFQWVRTDADGMNPTDIAGATSQTYTLTGAEAGKKVIVEVSFTDDAGNAEGPLASDAYPSVGTVTVADTDAPAFGSATVDGTALVITFDETLAAAANLVNRRLHGEGGRQRARTW